MPNVAKLSAGYYATPAMDLIDLFIGSEGTLGVIVEATLRVIPRPRRAVALIRCDTMPGGHSDGALRRAFRVGDRVHGRTRVASGAE